MLVSSVDHGATPPSALAARVVASTGGALNGSVAAGLLSINDFHGGAIEACARQLGHIVARCADSGEDLGCVAAAIIDEAKSEGRRLSGFGHRIHRDDPRTARLFELAEAAGAAGRHVEAARAVEAVFRSSGKSLPINVDGAIGAILADLGFDPAVMNGLFMIARVPGLIAHATEERSRQRPMRRIDPVNHTYDGPAPRSLEVF
jgi:citrate synthase